MGTLLNNNMKTKRGQVALCTQKKVHKLYRKASGEAEGRCVCVFCDIRGQEPMAWWRVGLFWGGRGRGRGRGWFISSCGRFVCGRRASAPADTWWSSRKCSSSSGTWPPPRSYNTEDTTGGKHNLFKRERRKRGFNDFRAEIWTSKLSHWHFFVFFVKLEHFWRYLLFTSPLCKPLDGSMFAISSTAQRQKVVHATTKAKRVSWVPKQNAVTL